MVFVARIRSERKLIFVWRLYMYLLRPAISIPLTGMARWTREWTTGDPLVTENKHW